MGTTSLPCRQRHGALAVPIPGVYLRYPPSGVSPGTQISKIDGSNQKWLTMNMAKQNGSVLNKVDYDEIGKRIRDAIDEKFAFLPTKKEYFETSDTIIKELKAIREDFAAHESSHERIDEDTSKLKKQVKHLFKTFEILDPTEVIPSY